MVTQICPHCARRVNKAYYKVDHHNKKTLWYECDCSRKPFQVPFKLGYKIPVVNSKTRQKIIDKKKLEERQPSLF